MNATGCLKKSLNSRTVSHFFRKSKKGRKLQQKIDTNDNIQKLLQFCFKKVITLNFCWLDYLNKQKWKDAYIKR